MRQERKISPLKVPYVGNVNVASQLKKYVSRSTEVVVSTAAILDPPDDSSLEIEPLLEKPGETIK